MRLRYMISLLYIQGTMTGDATNAAQEIYAIIMQQ